MPETLHLVVPVLNEEANLERLFAGFRELAAQLAGECAVRVLLVDDGSTDGTADRARRLGEGMAFTLLSYPENRGPGYAFASAYASLAGKVGDDDWVVTMEGDNTSRHQLLAQMLGRARREGYDVVLASPYMYGGGFSHTSLYRTFLSHCANLFIKKLLDVNGILTISSFYRLRRGRAFNRLQRHYGTRILERSGFEAMVEEMIKMVMLGFGISEIAMRLDTSLRAGKSKMNTLKTSLGYLGLWKEKARWRQLAQTEPATPQ